MNIAVTYSSSNWGGSREINFIKLLWSAIVKVSNDKSFLNNFQQTSTRALYVGFSFLFHAQKCSHFDIVSQFEYFNGQLGDL